MFRLTVAASVLASVADVDLITFDGAPSTTFKFTELNDPVMGGKSTGTWRVNATSAGSFGVFDGEVVDVPSLSAPGFIKAAADGKFNDASDFMGGDLVLTVRSSTPEYSGYRVAFVSGTTSASYACSGGGTLPLSRGCFKSKFSVPAGSDFSTVRVPFSSFSDKWSPATGEQTSTCADDVDVCPTATILSALQRVEVWAEGVAGRVHLEVLSISAAPKAVTKGAQRFGASVGGRPGGDNGFCQGPVQPKLLYGITGRAVATVPVQVDEGESLAEAVCCDKRILPFAEPQFLYEAPDINLFSALDATSGVTTFYDSVCGIPLFRTPVNRTLEAFKADTTEHGWPSFRTAEVVEGNVLTDMSTGYVTSTCGTHLGSYLPDEDGPRWCIDVACVAGSPL